ncbi:MAG: tetratricopeptide repeat protein, partial [Chloroherpetonaceae bacterium]|nr:tetratricopeptide repeat protein [Chloroherpetonaceae bacterium]
MLKLRVPKTYANKMKKPDTRKEIDRLLREASLRRLSNPRNALRLCKQAFELAESIADNLRAAKAHLKLATLAFDKSDFESLETHCRAIAQRAPKSFDLLGDCDVLLGLVEWQKGNHPNALERYLSAMNHWQKATMKASERQARTVNALINIGHLYAETSNYENALDHYFNALSQMTDQTDAHSRSTALRSIGSAYEYLQNFDRAIEFFEQSLKIVSETKNAFGECVTRYNLANTLWLKGCLKESLAELERASELARAAGDKRVEVATSVIQSAALADLNEKKKFEETYKKILAEVDALGIADIKVKSRAILAKSLMKMNQTKKALRLFDEANALAKRFNILSVEAEVQQELSKYYERVGKFEQALHCFKVAVVSLEKQRREDSERKLAMYEVERRIKTIQAEKAELERQLDKLRQELAKKKELTEKERENFSKSI